jgi:hypothetical protein
MWRRKKFIFAAILAAMILVVGIGGVVLAADNGDDNQTETKRVALVDRALEIYEEQTGVTIDKDVLKDAFAQAKSELRDEALQNRLDNLVADGVITQEEADEYLEWWQSKPDISNGFGLHGHGRVGMGGACALP